MSTKKKLVSKIKELQLGKKNGDDEISDKQNKSKPDTTGKKMSLVELSGRVGDNPQ